SNPSVDSVECLLDLSVVLKALHSSGDECMHPRITARCDKTHEIIDDFTDPLCAFGIASRRHGESPVGDKEDQSDDERSERDGQEPAPPGIAPPGGRVHAFFAFAQRAATALRAASLRSAAVMFFARALPPLAPSVRRRSASRTRALFGRAGFCNFRRFEAISGRKYPLDRGTFRNVIWAAVPPVLTYVAATY